MRKREKKNRFYDGIWKFSKSPPAVKRPSYFMVISVLSDGRSGNFFPFSERERHLLIYSFDKTPKKLGLTFPKRHILGPSKLKKFADYDYMFDENVRKFSKRIENTVGKGEIARNEQFFLFPQRFQKTFTADT